MQSSIRTTIHGSNWLWWSSGAYVHRVVLICSHANHHTHSLSTLFLEAKNCCTHGTDGSIAHPVVWIKEHICSFGLDCSHALQPTTPFTSFMHLSTFVALSEGIVKHMAQLVLSSSSTEQRSYCTLWCSYSPAYSCASQPTTTPICLKTVWDIFPYRCSPIVLANPKSQSFTTPRFEMRIFSGFTSR